MGGIKIRIHPLFFVFGVYFAFTGKLFLFLVYTACAVSHELGHALAAARFGYKINLITLLPFGAVADGNIDGLKAKDEAVIAIAGPLVNVGAGIFFVAMWWIFPETYAFTDLAAAANFSMAAINLLPVFPLDGGRIFSAVISVKYGREKAYKICRAVGVAVASAVMALFIVSVFYTFNLSLLIFAVTVLVFALNKKKGVKVRENLH